MLQFNEKMRQMAGMRVYIDTNILIYFFKKDPRYFSLVSSFLRQCADRKILGTVSQLVVAEVLVLSYRKSNHAMTRAKTLVTICQIEWSRSLEYAQ